METIKPSIRKIINEIFDKWGIQLSISYIYECWNATHRHYHTVENHLNPMLEDIVEFKNQYGLDQNSFEILILAALFHDIVYNPKSLSNEDDSSEYFNLSTELESEDINKVCEIIKMTKTHEPKDKLEELFSMFDLKVLTNDLIGLLKWEEQIYKEFEWVNWKTYRTERIKILQHFINRRNEIDVNYVGLQQLIYILENKIPNIAIYAGSFNPFSTGHQNIFEKSEAIFDKVIIAKGKNISKNINGDEYNREYDNLVKLYPTKEIVTYDCLLTDLIKEQEGNITLVRGIRSGFDLETENTQTRILMDIYPDLKVVYIPCDKEFDHVSSTAIRILKSYGVSAYIPIKN